MEPNVRSVSHGFNEGKYEADCGVKRVSRCGLVPPLPQSSIQSGKISSVGSRYRSLSPNQYGAKCVCVCGGGVMNHYVAVGVRSISTNQNGSSARLVFPNQYGIECRDKPEASIT